MQTAAKTAGYDIQLNQKIDAARVMLAALERMIADLREQEATRLCSRMRIQQIVDIERAIKEARAAGVTPMPSPLSKGV